MLDDIPFSLNFLLSLGFTSTTRETYNRGLAFSKIIASLGHNLRNLSLIWASKIFLGDELTWTSTIGDLTLGIEGLHLMHWFLRNGKAKGLGKASDASFRMFTTTSELNGTVEEIKSIHPTLLFLEVLVWWLGHN